MSITKKTSADGRCLFCILLEFEQRRAGGDDAARDDMELWQVVGVGHDDGALGGEPGGADGVEIHVQQGVPALTACPSLTSEVKLLPRRAMVSIPMWISSSMPSVLSNPTAWRVGTMEVTFPSKGA